MSVFFLREKFSLGAQTTILRMLPGVAAHGAHVIDRFAAHKVLGIVAGQLEVGYLFHRITGGSAADMRVILHGHDRKVAKVSTRGGRRGSMVRHGWLLGKISLALTAAAWGSLASMDNAGHPFGSSDCWH